MDALALWIGYAILTSGGVVLAGVIVSSSLDYLWTKLKEVKTFVWLREAIQHYEKIKPSEDSLRKKREDE
jgi:hypothetical protein